MTDLEKELPGENIIRQQQQRRHNDGFGKRAPRRKHHQTTRRSKPIQIITSSDDASSSSSSSSFAEMHDICRAARYKVHKPLCSCSKIKGLREGGGQGIFLRSRSTKAAALLHDVSTTTRPQSQQLGSCLYNSSKVQNHHQNNVPGSLIGSTDGDNNNNEQKQLAELLQAHLHVTTPYGPNKGDCDDPVSAQAADAVDADEADVGTTEKMMQRNALDGLVVLPESTRFVPAVYVCSGTSHAAKNWDRVKNELKLRQEMFPSTAVSVVEVPAAKATKTIMANSKNSQSLSFKVSCAACLLQEEPNGFVCISGADPDALSKYAPRDFTTRREDLHADHAHYLAIVDESILWKNYSHRRDRKKSFPAAQIELCNALLKQGVPVNDVTATAAAATADDDDTFTRYDGGGNVTSTTITYGHHLTSLLLIFKRQLLASSRDKEVSASIVENAKHWLVLVYQQGSSSTGRRWVLDLPGGKRHLGETTVESAIRETREESSLEWDQSWMVHSKPFFGDEDDSNAYFFLTPPPPIRHD